MASIKLPRINNISDVKDLERPFNELVRNLEYILRNIDVDNMRNYKGDTLPDAIEKYRGKIFTLQIGAGSADEVYVCVKNATDVYEWAPFLIAVST